MPLMICYWFFLKLYHDSLVKIVGYLYMYYTTQIKLLTLLEECDFNYVRGSLKIYFKINPPPLPRKQSLGVHVYTCRNHLVRLPVSLCNHVRFIFSFRFNIKLYYFTQNFKASWASSRPLEENGESITFK